MNNKNILYKCEFLRGLSALMVFIGHYAQIFLAPIYTHNFIITWYLARFGVIAFFILSGYLISLSIFNNINKYGQFNIKEYSLNRIIRIYPPLIFSIILVYVLFLIIHTFHMHGEVSYFLKSDLGKLARDKFDFNFKSAIYTLTESYTFYKGEYLVSNGPLWSLSYEVGFYIISGLIVNFIYKFKSKNLFYLLTNLLLFLFIFSLFHYNHIDFFYYLSIWLIGVIFQLFIYNVNLLKQILIIPLSSLIIFFSISNKLNIENIKDYIFCIFTCTFLFHKSVHIKQTVYLVQKIADSSKFSYTLYIVHFPLMLFIFSLIHSMSSNHKFIYIFTTLFLCFSIIILSSLTANILENKKVLLNTFNLIKNRLDFLIKFITIGKNLN